MSDKRFDTVYRYLWSSRYIDQSLLTGFHGKSTVTVVKHTFIWNQSTKQHDRIRRWIIGSRISMHIFISYALSYDKRVLQISILIHII
jgi:hypothetical protein